MQAASPSAHPAQLVNRLDGSAPNPLSPHGVLRFSLAEPCSASLRVQDLDGQPVRSLVDGASAAGAHQVAWDGRDDAGDVLPPSVYLARLEVWTLDRTVLAFADSTWFGIFTPDPDDEATWLGFTGADGRVTSTDRARFPCLYSHPPLIARTEEGVELGTFLYTDTLAIVVQDTVSGEFRTSRQFLGPGANRFEIRF